MFFFFPSGLNSCPQNWFSSIGNLKRLIDFGVPEQTTANTFHISLWKTTFIILARLHAEFLMVLKVSCTGTAFTLMAEMIEGNWFCAHRKTLKPSTFISRCWIHAPNLGWHSQWRIRSSPGGPLWPPHWVHLHQPINTHKCFSSKFLHCSLSILKPNIHQGNWLVLEPSSTIYQSMALIGLTTKYESIGRVFKHSRKSICKLAVTSYWKT